MKQKCQRCKEWYPATTEYFRIHRGRETGLQGYCITCQRKYRNSDSQRWASMRYKYGVTRDDYDDMLTSQGNRCGCCRRHISEFKKPLYIDHDHETGKFRGLLCNNCNSGIGKLGDNEEGILLALDYLRKGR